MTGRVLYRCSCSYAIVVDEGNTFRVSLGHWRINKKTGRVTAQCPRCPKVHEIEPGVEGQQGTFSRSFSRLLHACSSEIPETRLERVVLVGI